MKSAKILTALEREYVKDPKKRERYTKSVQRQYDYRIRVKAKHMMKDLEFLATYLPESQQEQIFIEEFLLPMIKAVLNPKRQDVPIKMRKRKKEYRHRSVYVANERLFCLSNKLIEIATEAGYELIPSEIANLFAVGENYRQQTELVKKLGQFIRRI